MKKSKIFWMIGIVMILLVGSVNAFDTKLTLGFTEEIEFTHGQLLEINIIGKDSFEEYDSEGKNPTTTNYWVIKSQEKKYSLILADDGQYYISENDNPNADTKFYELTKKGENRLTGDTELTRESNWGLKEKLDNFDTEQYESSNQQTIQNNQPDTSNSNPQNTPNNIQTQESETQFIVTAKGTQGETVILGTFKSRLEAQQEIKRLGIPGANIVEQKSEYSTQEVIGIKREAITNQDGNIIGYIVKIDGQTIPTGKLLTQEEANTLARNEFLKQEMKGYSSFGTNENGDTLIFERKGVLYEVQTSFNKNEKLVFTNGAPTPLTPGQNYKIIDKKHSNIVKTYRIAEEGSENEFLYAQLKDKEGNIIDTQISDDISLGYITSALSAAGSRKNPANIIEENDEIIIQSNQGRNVLSYSKSDSQQKITQYDLSGREKREIVRSDVLGKDETTKETLFRIRTQKDEKGNTISYSAEGITYEFKYDSEGKFVTREKAGFTFIAQNGEEYNAVIENGKLVGTKGIPPDILSAMKTGLSQATWRERFSILDYTIDTFSGMGFYSSLFMSDQEIAQWRNTIDKLFNNVILGGPRYWVSEICENQYDMSSSEIAYSEKYDGIKVPSAHVEAEKSSLIPIPYGDEMIDNGRLYKMSFYVKATYLDVSFNVYLSGAKNTKLFPEDIELKGDDNGEGDEYIFNCRTNSKCAQYSFNDYDEICIKFSKNGDIDASEVCNTIVESDYTYNNFEASGELFVSEDSIQKEQDSQETISNEPIQI